MAGNTNSVVLIAWDSFEHDDDNALTEQGRHYARLLRMRRPPLFGRMGMEDSADSVTRVVILMEGGDKAVPMAAREIAEAMLKSKEFKDAGIRTYTFADRGPPPRRSGLVHQYLTQFIGCVVVASLGRLMEIVNAAYQERNHVIRPRPATAKTRDHVVVHVGLSCSYDAAASTVMMVLGRRIGPTFETLRGSFYLNQIAFFSRDDTGGEAEAPDSAHHGPYFDDSDIWRVMDELESKLPAPERDLFLTSGTSYSRQAWVARTESLADALTGFWVGTPIGAKRGPVCVLGTSASVQRGFRSLVSDARTNTTTVLSLKHLCFLSLAMSGRRAAAAASAAAAGNDQVAAFLNAPALPLVGSHLQVKTARRPPYVVRLVDIFVRLPNDHVERYNVRFTELYNNQLILLQT